MMKYDNEEPAVYEITILKQRMGPTKKIISKNHLTHILKNNGKCYKWDHINNPKPGTSSFACVFCKLAYLSPAPLEHCLPSDIYKEAVKLYKKRYGKIALMEALL